MKKCCMDRKTVVFLPLVKTSQKFKDILTSKGFGAAEVNGDSGDRSQVLSDFDAGKYNVLCNSMLLTEGGTVRLLTVLLFSGQPRYAAFTLRWLDEVPGFIKGKEYLLILDFLWHTEKHELCHPASLICENEEVAAKMTENIEEAGCPVDIEEAEREAEGDIIAAREKKTG
jgi:hypothetical protein